MGLALKNNSQLSLVEKTALYSDRYLGPAKVVDIIGRNVQLEVATKRIMAISAISFPYQAELGDIVLVINQDDAWYIIGVLEGTGKTIFTVPGDIAFQAPRGNISLTASNEIKIRSTETKIIAKEIEFSAISFVEKFDNARRWIKETYHLQAGRVRSVVKQSYRLKAGKIVQRAEKEVKIDGTKIKLG